MSSKLVAVTARPRTDSAPWLPSLSKTPSRTETALPLPRAVILASSPTAAMVSSTSTTMPMETPTEDPLNDRPKVPA